ncbi:hypothetical protein ROHU_017245 [Labeo rohita]|uniref:Uncharacterized protein n=1 Tax=Labeo rohita TaxID=84645 RepID=A0A498NH45_LABRO|nr:hypothetical protein ROHU_012201 [Labeo rohita]RXN31173.1 hypothetical protein ROHU_017245 [Labeo rohita]
MAHERGGRILYILTQLCDSVITGGSTQMFDDMHHYIRLAKEECSAAMKLKAELRRDTYKSELESTRPPGDGRSNHKPHHNSFT